MKKTKIKLRALSESDMDQVADWMSDFKDIAMFDRSLPVPISRQALDQSWKTAFEAGDPPRAFWFIAVTEQNEAVGMCGLQSISYIHGDAVVPLFVTKGYRGKGLAKIMGLALVDLAFNHLRLNRLSTVYRADNSGTEQLVKNLGFTEEGRVREGWFANGKYNDIVQVGFLRSEWQEKRPQLIEKLSNLPFVVIDNVIADSH